MKILPWWAYILMLPGALVFIVFLGWIIDNLPMNQ